MTRQEYLAFLTDYDEGSVPTLAEVGVETETDATVDT